MKEFTFNAVLDYAIGQSCKVSKNDHFCRHFAKTLTRSAEHLYIRAVLDGYFSNFMVASCASSRSLSASLGATSGTPLRRQVNHQLER